VKITTSATAKVLLSNRCLCDRPDLFALTVPIDLLGVGRPSQEASSIAQDFLVLLHLSFVWKLPEITLAVTILNSNPVRSIISAAHHPSYIYTRNPVNLQYFLGLDFKLRSSASRSRLDSVRTNPRGT
jgi:hypothetical protein